MTMWQTLPKPFTILAPMEEVTDTVFRQIVMRAGKPDVFFTEFCNVDGLQSKGREKVIHRLQYTKGEHPIVAQIWGNTPEHYYTTAKELVEVGFDGIDINMGCPEKDVIKSGSCIALINNRTLAAEIIDATRRGAGNLPVSVKTRIGLNTIATEDWCGWLLSQHLDALTVHGRTAKEQSDFPAHWDEIGKVVKLRDQMKLKTMIIGNGDVRDKQDAQEKAQTYGVDGVMIGRGIFENLWCFSDHQPTQEERLYMLIEHARLWEKTWGRTKHFAIMRKFVKAYVKGWDGASELRAKLMTANSTSEMEEMISTLSTTFKMFRRIY